jgi:hypothetical protein
MTIDEAINVADSGDRTDNDPLAVLAEEVRRLRGEVVSAQFWREHAQRTNTELEQDYLAIWKAVKEPDKTVLESVLALKARVSR